MRKKTNFCVLILFLFLAITSITFVKAVPLDIITKHEDTLFIRLELSPYDNRSSQERVYHTEDSMYYKLYLFNMGNSTIDIDIMGDVISPINESIYSYVFGGGIFRT